MTRVKYNENERPIIYLVATPIGNLGEITPRAIEVLNEVSYIFCEDTRVSSKLLNHFNIKNKNLESFHLHNEFEKNETLLACVNEHKKIAVISDAGYPIISDPGQGLVQLALANDINVVTINGPSAILPALISSGFKSTPFTFIGFVSNKPSEAIEQLTTYKDYKHTIVLYESCHRFNKTLKHILDVFGDVDVCLSRELTKINEEHIYGTVSDLLFEQLELKGELVICVDNSKISETVTLSEEFILNKINELLESNVSKKDAIKKISKEYGLEKNMVYAMVHKK